jgi:hypothetical protein
MLPSQPRRLFPFFGNHFSAGYFKWNCREETMRERFLVKLACPCGATGEVVWEGNAPPNTRGHQPILYSLSDGFYEQVEDGDGQKVVACLACGTPVLEEKQVMWSARPRSADERARQED